MNLARLNFSHGDRDTHAAVLTRARDLAEQLGVPLALLQDLAGPKVRVGPIAGGSVTLEVGQAFVLTTAAVDGTRERASVSYAALLAAVSANDTLLLADGAIVLRVESVAGDEIRCRVIVGGRLASRKGVSVPSGLPDLPILSDKDLDDLRFGLERGVDYVGLSFVRTAVDFFAVPTLTCRLLFGFVILRHHRRELIHIDVTDQPTATWAAQQIVHAFPDETGPLYLLRDRDAIYCALPALRRAHGHSPGRHRPARSLAESLRASSARFAANASISSSCSANATDLVYYNVTRPHQSLDNDSPRRREGVGPVRAIVTVPEVGGLHHRYQRVV